MDLKSRHSLNDFSKVTFTNIGHEIYSAKKVTKVIGIWDSLVLDGTEYLLAWKNIECMYSLNAEDERVYIYTRSSDSQDMEGIEWSGPNLNDMFNLDSNSRYIQLRIVILATYAVPSPYQTYQTDMIGPTVSQLKITGITSATSSLFFTKTFELGFFPKSIVLTSESDVPENSILRFAVSSLDSTSSDDYQFIDQNKVVDLDQLAVTGSRIKIMIEMSGNSGTPVVVHEFATMFSGDGQKSLN